MKTPKNSVDKLSRIISAWETLAPNKTFGGLTLAEFKAGVKPSFDTREELRVLDTQTQAKQVERDNADTVSLDLAQRVINGVIGDPEEGPDSDIYGEMGFVRKSQRRTGLTRKKKAGAKNSNNKSS